MRRVGFILGCVLFWPLAAAAQNWGTVTGRVTEQGTGAPIPGVTIVVSGTNYGTASDGDGRYALRIPTGRYLLAFSAIGYEAQQDSVRIRRDQATTLDVRLATALIEMEGVTVEEAAPVEAGVFRIDPEAARNIPSPVKDGYRVLKVMPGVVANNELSYQYSVRGGGFNENLVFINGFEVYLPFRPRQGEQEGLGLLNPDLTDQLTFYTGGFPARYGGKLSSALDARYRRPESARVQGRAYASLLDFGATAEAAAFDRRLGWIFGVRKARARRFFATQERKGDYDPDYFDFQGMLSYRLAPGHEVEALGMVAEHQFNLDPTNSRTYFGTISLDPDTPSNLKSLWINYSGQQRDGYATQFAGLRLKNRLTDRLRVAHDVAFFATKESERFEIVGSSILYQVDPGGSPDNTEEFFDLGNSRQEDYADNTVAVDTWTAQGRYLFTTRHHAAEAGWFARSLRFDDRIDEASIVEGRDRNGEQVRIVVDSLTDRAALTTQQVGLYVQDAVDVFADTPGRLLITAGVRADYFDFNGEWTVSPRLSARYRFDANLTLTGALGLYHQAPTYRELRGKPAPGETILGALNRDLKSQRAVQVIGGFEYLLEKYRFYLRGEVFYKRIADVISYDIENVRIHYSGENDASSNTYGLDLQLRGEFVPGLESWLNYSFLVAEETFAPAFQTAFNQGAVPRPTDQRHTVSLFLQDYIPDDPTWKIFMRTLFGSGLPYTPPVEGPRIGNIVTQLPGQRFSERFLRYFRFDAGIAKEIVVFEGGGGPPVQMRLSAEILNVFNMVNTVAYSWVPDNDGIWNRIPTRLTPRTLNVRLNIEF